ncbi:hypothetical protein Hanom_Chr10g00954571 [Helianthus anomalus]
MPTIFRRCSSSDPSYHHHQLIITVIISSQSCSGHSSNHSGFSVASLISHLSQWFLGRFPNQSSDF